MSFRDHLEKVRYFRAVCDAGSFRKAAEQLHLSQSSLTVAIKKLEGSVGERLLIRTKKGTRPTAAGDMVLAFARDLGFRVEDLEARLRAPDGTAAAGRLRVGAYDSIAVYWLPRVLRHLRRVLPNVSLSVSIGSSGVLTDRVRAGDLDLAVAVAPTASGPLRIDELFKDRFSIFGTRQVGRDLVHLIGNFAARVAPGQSLSDVLHERGIATAEGLEVESFEIAKSLALESVGPAVLPHRVAEFGPAAKRLVRVGGTPHSFGVHSICLVTLDELHERNRLVRRVTQEMRAVRQA